VLPTIFAIIYFGFLAPDIYISESRFVVRSPEKQTSSALGALLKAPGISVAGDEIYSVQEYVESRDALSALNKDGLIDNMMAAKKVDWIERLYTLDWHNTFEAKYRFFKRRVDVQNESASTISIMKTRSYRPEDSYLINKRLLDLGEALVNRLNERSREDLIQFARLEVDRARESAKKAAMALAAFRNRNSLVDPDKQATIGLQLISKLQDELIAAKTQLLQLRAFAPQNPQVPVLQTQIGSLSREIDHEIAKIAGGGKSLAAVNVEYQRLALESQFADKQLAGAMASLESARNDARRKQIYLETIVRPNVPDEALEPNRLRNIFSTFVLGLIAWGISSMLLAGLREHKD
tara:strand:+ start:10321 stop:11370 length:1050 start_codon:yes stop_codon:yes gene_type:complete